MKHKFQGGTDTSAGKVNILLQAYISGYRPEDFALVSDQAYAAQNGGRIARGLLEIAISRKWGNAAFVLMGISKAIEKRMWPYEHPLKQFEGLKADTLHNLERWADDYDISDLAEMSAEEVGKLIHLNEKHGLAVRNAAKQFPTVRISYSLRPLGADVLKIAVKIERAYNWSSKLHGSIEPFWLWVEDHKGTNILQLSHLIFRQTTTFVDVDFVISVPKDKPPPSVTIRYVSDRWIGAEEELVVSFEDLIMPTWSESHTVRLDIPFLPLSVLRNPPLQEIFSHKVHGLNAIQSQVYWSIVRTRSHALFCAPTGCGKSIIGQLTIWCASFIASFHAYAHELCTGKLFEIRRTTHGLWLWRLEEASLLTFGQNFGRPQEPRAARSTLLERTISSTSP